jgi:uncharacterized pyridoxal phosphate-dependent enzyme
MVKGINTPRFINAVGTLTSLGGCRTRPEVIQAMTEVAGDFVFLEEYHRAAGEYLAKLIGVEAAVVTSGAAAGLTLATAACMEGDDAALATKLQNSTQKHKVIIQCSHRNPFERAIQLAGASLVQIGDSIRTHRIDLESAFDDDVAAVCFFLQAEMLDASMSLEKTIATAHANNIPVIVDAAAELPPKSNLWGLTKGGADLVIFSGSKDLRGPQTSGLMVGRSDLINSVMNLSAPHENVIGRPLKAGKEIIAGILAAMELYLTEDETDRFREWEEIAKLLEDGLSQIPTLEVRRFIPDQPYIQPAIVPRVGVKIKCESTLTLSDVKSAMWDGYPPIVFEVVNGELWINVHTLRRPEAEIILQRFVDICS